MRQVMHVLDAENEDFEPAEHQDFKFATPGPRRDGHAGRHTSCEEEASWMPLGLQCVCLQVTQCGQQQRTCAEDESRQMWRWFLRTRCGAGVSGWQVEHHWINDESNIVWTGLDPYADARHRWRCAASIGSTAGL
eukprot:6485981-Amphidinium_carterae.1